MEENLKNLLKEIIEQENLRNDKLQTANQRLETVRIQEETRIERFEQGFLQDVNSGVYNMTDGQIKKELDEGKSKISQEFDNERATIREDIAKLQEENERENKNRNPRITNALNEYKAELITSEIELKRNIKNVEQEKNEKLQEIDKQKAEKQARYTHLIMKNRDVMDLHHQDAGEITILAREIEDLNSQRNEISNTFDSQIANLKAQGEKLRSNLEKVNQFYSSVRLSDKTTKEIYEMLFEKEEPVKTTEKEDTEKQNTEKQDTKQQKSNAQDQKTQEQKTQEQKTQDQKTQDQKTQEQKTQEQKTQDQKTQEQKTQEQKTQEQKSQEPNSTFKKFSYVFSTKGVKYEGKNIDIEDLLEWNEKHSREIEEAIKDVIGDKETTEDFLDYSDKLIYTSILLKDATTKDGKIQLTPLAKERLKTYHDVWLNPESQKESDMIIRYDLRKTSVVSRLFKKWERLDEELPNIRDNAYLLRNRNNVTVEKGFFTKIQFRIKEMIDNQKSIKKLDAPKEQPKVQTKEETSHENFVERLNPKNQEYSHVEEKTNQPEKSVEQEKDADAR